jgi:hypothetical protein
MATDTTYAAVRGMLETQFTAAPLYWENEIQDPPTDTTWVLVEFAGDAYEQTSIGAGERADNRWVESGIVYLHIMSPRGAGAQEPRRIARLLAEVFRDVTELSPNIEFDRTSIGLGGMSDPDGAFWRLPMSVSYEREF